MFKRFTASLAGLLVACNGVAAVYNLGISSNGVPVLPTNSAFVQATNLGDILVGMGTNVARQAVGANGLVLTADSSASNGVTWAAAGAGTVMSVGIAATSPLFGVSNSPITVTGDIALTNTYQVSNSVMAGPVSGTNAAPTFRALVAADVPQLAATKTGTGAVDDTEFGYLDGVTSGIQGQINAKLDSTTAEALSLSADDFLLPAMAATNVLLGLGWDYHVQLVPGPTWAEAGYLAGVTSALQTQLDRRGLSLLGQLTNVWLWGNLNMTNVGGYGLSTDWDGPDMMIYGRNLTESAAIANVNVLGGGLGGVNIYMPLYFNSGLTASRVLVLDGSSKLTSSSVTTTELDYLGGITGRPVTTNAFTTKGDLLSFSGLSLTRLPAGGNGQVLSVDNSTSTGLRWLTVGGIGTVTSVGLSGTAEIGVSGSPVTAAGTIVLTNAYQAANTVFAGPASGTNTTPAFRSLVAADMPTGIDATKIADGSVNNTMFQSLTALADSGTNTLVRRTNGEAAALSLFDVPEAALETGDRLLQWNEASARIRASEPVSNFVTLPVLESSAQQTRENMTNHVSAGFVAKNSGSVTDLTHYGTMVWRTNTETHDPLSLSLRGDSVGGYHWEHDDGFGPIEIMGMDFNGVYFPTVSAGTGGEMAVLTIDGRLDRSALFPADVVTTTQTNALVAAATNAANADLMNKLFSGYTVATLPTAVAPGHRVWCSDAVTSDGTGDLVLWNGSSWMTQERVQATASFGDFITNGNAPSFTSGETLWVNEGFQGQCSSFNSVLQSGGVVVSINGGGNSSRSGSFTEVQLSCRPTNTTSGAGIFYTQSTPNDRLSGRVTFGARINIAGGDFSNSVYSVGMQNARFTSTPTSGIMWMARPEWTSNYIAAVGKASTWTYVTSSLPTLNAQTNRVVLAVSGDTNSLTFWTNGGAFTTVTSNIPTGVAVGFFAQVVSTTAAGTANPNTLNLDWLKASIEFASPP